MKGSNMRLVTLIGLLLLFSAQFICAQDFRSKLTGQVTDPSGAAVPNAVVTAVMQSTGQTYTTKTSSEGVYFIPYALPGTYTVTVKASGFRTHVQENVHLIATRAYGLNFKLQVGTVSQTVTVTGTPPLIETASGSGGTLIQGKELEALPLNGRQVYTLIGTTPGSQFLTTTFGAAGASGTRGWDVSKDYKIGGGARGFNSFTLNGTNMTLMAHAGAAGMWMAAPNVDAIQEVSVMSNTYDARYGRTGGGVVNIVTKAGTNAYHGDAYDYLENGIMNANNFENNMNGVPTQDTKQNQFGGTFGGPIKRNKIFFFGSYEGYRESIPFTTLTSVPPAYMRPQPGQGVNFTQSGYTIYDPLTTACTSGGSLGNCPGDQYASQAFPNDTIPANRISPIGAAFLNLFPLPNIPGAGYRNNYIAQTPDRYRYDQPMVRVDYNTSDKTRWYSMFEWQKGYEFRNSSGFTGPAQSGDINSMRENVIASQDMTHIFSPTLVGDFKLSFSRFKDFFPNGPLSTPTPNSFGLNMPDVPTTTLKLLPQITFGEIYPQVVGNQVVGNVYQNSVLDADFTKSKGRHTIEFGGEFGKYFYANNFPGPGVSPNGAFSFGTQSTQNNPLQRGTVPGVTDGNVIADLLLGYPAGGQVDWNNEANADNSLMWDLYAQDNIRVNRRLTLQIGVRYDVQSGPTERYNRQTRGMCLTCVNPITSNPTFQANLAADSPYLTAAGIDPASLATVYGGLLFAGVNGQPSNGYNTDWTNIGPRFGFAYEINPKTVVRGGYGWMYSYAEQASNDTFSFGGIITNNGFSISTPYINSLNGVTQTTYFASGTPFPNGVQQPAGSSLGLLTGVGGGQLLDYPQRRIPRIQIMSLGVQRQLPGHMLLDVKYAGNYGRDFPDPYALDTLPQSGYDQLQQGTWNFPTVVHYAQQVPNPYYGVVPANTSLGSSSTVNAFYLMLPFSQFPGVGNYTIPGGGSWFDALEATLEKRLYGQSRGMTFLVSYTYSKTMQRGGYKNYLPWHDPQQTYEIDSYDRTNVLTWSAVWNLPFGKGAKYILPNPPRPLGAVVNDWKLSWIFSDSTGFPMYLNTGVWRTTTHGYTPDGGPTFGQWVYNCNGVPKNCYGNIPPLGQVNLPDVISNLRQPHIANVDMSLAKNFPITENKQFQFRVDAFNLANTPLFPGPDMNTSDGPPVHQANGNWQGYGTINLFQQNFPRIIQVSLKFIF